MRVWSKAVRLSLVIFLAVLLIFASWRSGQRVISPPIIKVVPVAGERFADLQSPVTITAESPWFGPLIGQLSLILNGDDTYYRSAPELVDSRTLQFSNDRALANDTEYLAELRLGPLKITSWSFKTSSLEYGEKAVQGQEIITSSRVVGSFFQNLYTNQPFLKSYPIRTANYFVTYDGERDTFLIGLIDQGTDRLAAIARSQAEIFAVMKETGVDPTQVKIEWKLVTPIKR